MTKVILLENLRAFSQTATSGLMFPVARQKGDPEDAPKMRRAEIFLMRLPDSTEAKKKAPYIIHQVLNGKDSQQEGQQPDARAVVRSIFCVHHFNEEEGGLALLTLMEALRVALLSKGVIGDSFVLDLEAGIETLVYPDDTAPYFAGEMITTWKMPPIRRREVMRVVNGMPAIDPRAIRREETIPMPPPPRDEPEDDGTSSNEGD